MLRPRVCALAPSPASSTPAPIHLPLRVRPSTIAMAAAMALVFAGLFVALRSLATSETDSVEADAKESAAVARSFLMVQAEALSALHGLYLDGTGAPPTDSAFDRLVHARREHVRRFRHLWITDSAGVVLREYELASGRARPLPRRIDVDTVAILDLAAAAERARETGRTVVTAPGQIMDGEIGFLVVEPIVIDGRFLGFAGGAITVDSLHAALPDRSSLERRALFILTDTVGGDTVTRIVDSPAPHTGRHADAPIELPGGGGAWMAAVRYPERSRTQLQLWGVALAALGALVVGGWHERRQTRRIADRSRELEHLSQELLRANRAKSEFLANVSHELRTPLNAIVGFTELLRDGVYGELGPRQAGPVQRIEASAQHLRELVDQVLDLAKMAAGRLEVHPEWVDLRQFVLDVATEIEPLLTEHGLAFSLAVSSSTPRLRTDPSHLRQILVNLLGNALKFTDQGGITVRTRVVSPTMSGDGLAALRAHAPDATVPWVALQVIDTGVGIAPRDQERVFDEFEQVNPGSRGDSDRRGTGLGLPISRRLAHLLGGDLTVESTVGKGSTFTVWLPVES